MGGLMLAYIVASAVYSITEAGFRMLDLMWVFLLLAVVGASRVGAGLFEGKQLKIPDSRVDAARKVSVGN